tara:strand:- start:1485 stop:3074 length:1590 start_codon:yes stop_codon:yes gene_type:complete
MTKNFRSDLPQWHALDDHSKTMKDTYIRDLFKADDKGEKTRFDDFHIRLDSMLYDFSKQRLNRDTIDKLCAYAQACDLEGWRSKMFGGEAINITEDRAVLHTALRNGTDEGLMINGQDIHTDIKATLKKMKVFSNALREEKRFTHIVNIGIGGSDLGAAMAYEALRPFADPTINVHFVSNVDASHLAEALKNVEPEKTLFIVASKTFTTQETITNANTAKRWLQEKLGVQDVSDHFVAISQNIDGAAQFGITPDRIFPIWDWVGGRFSLWSAVGLALCIGIGYDNFATMLGGAHAMDTHFKTAPLRENIPVMLSLIGMWNRNFLNYESLAVIPYDQYLHRFPAYLQQLDMESNGKSVDRNHHRIPYHTGPIIFGEAGTNSQHAFFQLIHQGTNIVPCEFIMTIKSQNPTGDHQNKLLANAIAQTKALMDGRTHDDPHKVFEGNRPSSTLVLEELTPYTLGMLIALYEHKIFVQGVLWNINSFDQCGVELGKVLAGQIVQSLDKTTKQVGDAPDTDSSTDGLIRLVHQSS